MKNKIKIDMTEHHALTGISYGLTKYRYISRDDINMPATAKLDDVAYVSTCKEPITYRMLAYRYLRG